MGLHSPRTKLSPQALKAAAVGTAPDLIELWKAHVRTSFSRPPVANRSTSEARRRAQAVVSGALALGFAYAIFTPRSVPLLPCALTLLALSASRAAYEALKEQRDERSGVSRRSSDAQAELAAGHAAHAVTISRAALEIARSGAQRRKLWATLAWAGISERDPFLTHLALQHLPAADIDAHLLAAYLGCCNRDAEAEGLLLEARAAGQRSPETTKQLIELSFARGDRAAIRALPSADAEFLSTSERNALALALAPPTAGGSREDAPAHAEVASLRSSV